MEIKVNLQLEKHTKNKYVYTAAGGAISSLYLDKNEMPNPPPNKITVTVSANND